MIDKCYQRLWLNSEFDQDVLQYFWLAEIVVTFYKRYNGYETL